MIEGWIGRPGSGKTYTLVARALKERDRGRDVFANFPIDGCWVFEPEDLLELPPGLIIIDEAHLWFSARQAISLPPSWLAEMSQTRKNSWDIIWSAQHENRVDRVIRDVSNWLYLTTCWFPRPGGGPPRLFRTQCYEPEFFRRPKKSMVTAWYPFRWSVAEAYDTMGRVELAEHSKRKSDPYSKRRSA